jgi:hypothetical protein
MARRRMRGAAALCAVTAPAAGCPGVTAAVPAAPGLRALKVAAGAHAMQQPPQTPGSTLHRCFRGTRDGVALAFPDRSTHQSIWRKEQPGNAHYLGALRAYRLELRHPLIAYPARF